MPSARAATWVGQPAFAGPFLFATVAVVAALAVTVAAPQRVTGALPPRPPMRDAARSQTVRSAFAVMATAQVVMVAVMTAAPLDMHLHGEGLHTVGVALSAHTLGMFALSPITGWLLQRAGPRPVMLGGLLTLATATALAATTRPGGIGGMGALFLLGYGWNLCFVGGSAQLANDITTADRARIEGAVDAAVWGVAALASLISTVILAAGGYMLLVICAGALTTPAALLLLKSHHRPRAVEPHPEQAISPRHRQQPPSAQPAQPAHTSSPDDRDVAAAG